MKTYSEKLRDPRWQRKRLEIMQRDNFKCTQCGDASTTQNIHHWKYNGDPWEAGDENLSTVCEKCHKAIERIKKEGIPINKDNARMHILCGYNYNKPVLYKMFLVLQGDVTPKLHSGASLTADGNTLLMIEIFSKRTDLQYLMYVSSSIINDLLNIADVISSTVEREGETILWLEKSLLDKGSR